MKFDIKEIVLVPGIHHTIEAEEIVGSHIYSRKDGQIALVYLIRVRS